MYVEEVELRSSPGLPRPIHLRGLRPGLVLLVGPNASGKSTLGRLLRGTLWPKQAPAGMDARTTWRIAPGGAPHVATLVFGRTGWDGEALQPDVDSSASWQLTLQELLATSATSDQAIAGAIQRQLDGGYDLAALEPTKAPRQRPTPAERKGLRDASTQLRTLLDATDALQDDEARLVALKQRAAAAAAAPARLVLVDEALTRLTLRGRLLALQDAQTQLPDNLAALPDDAVESVEKLTFAARVRRQAVDRRRVEHDEAVQLTARLAFASGDPGAAQTEGWEITAENLLSDAQRVDTLREQHELARSSATTLAGQVWSDAALVSLPSRVALETLSSVAADLAAARAHAKGLAAALESATPTPLDRRAHDGLREARRLLQRWLTSEREVHVVAALTPPTRVTLLLLLAACCLGLVGAGLAMALSAWLGLPLVGLGIGLAGAAIGLYVSPGLIANNQTTTGEADASSQAALAIAALEQQYRRGGHPSPTAWTFDAVAAGLAELEGALRDADDAAAQAITAQQRRHEHDAAQTEVVALQRDLDAAAADFGLAADLPALALHIQASRVINLAEARVAQQQRADALTVAERALHIGITTLRAALSALQIADVATLATPDEVLRASQRVSKRREAWRLANERRPTTAAELADAEAALRTATAEHDAYLTRCGVTRATVDQLPARTAQKAQWRALQEEASGVAQRLNELEEKLPFDLELDSEQLEITHLELAQLADELATIQREISDIEHNIHSATAGRAVHDALRTRDVATDALVRARDAAYADHTTAALLAWLRRQRRQEDTPALLVRARAWFLRFTRNRYELQIGAGDRFLALDMASQRQQSLSELSSGTRVQLLLAARLAFIEHSEQGGDALPLFLDEVLSTTDPARFAAIASAVLELAKAGRQVFYATADPGEAQAWRLHADQHGFEAPQVCLLGAGESVDAWTPRPTLLEAPVARSWPPPPASTDPIAHVAALNLPRPTLHDDADTWPLALLLRDHLDAAWRAAELGIQVGGKLRLQMQGVPLPLDDTLIGLAQARLQAVRATLDALQIGRGKPVTWTAVQDSKAISAKFDTAVRVALAKHQDAPESFVQAVATIPKFRANQVKKLSEYLEEVGILDPTPPLPLDEVVARVTVACADQLRARQLGLVDVPVWVALVAEVVGVEV